MSEQNSLSLEETSKVDDVGKYKFEPIKSYPMLYWHGKRPFTSTQYYPAQKKEIYGEEVDGWINKIFWGDNLQVMSHLLKEHRGKVDLIYIDPPFDSKADYKKIISIKSVVATSDNSNFEEKQYSDIWTNDEYLQFMYERLIILRELLSESGSIYLHCDPTKGHYLKCIMDEVFGCQNFRNEIVWCYKTSLRSSPKSFGKDHDTIYFYSKSNASIIHPDKADFPSSESTLKRWGPYADENGFVSNKHFAGSNSTIINTEDEDKGFNINYGIPRDWWEISSNVSKGNTGEVKYGKYPTQKPKALIERIIKASSNPGDLVFDCFMGSGTTQLVAAALNRRFIGADINLGAIQLTAKRLLDIETNFEIFNVNNYDIFRNPIEAKTLLLDALEIEVLSGTIYDGEKDGYKVKVMPVNRIATREDLNELIANFPYKVFDQRKEENPNIVVESIMLICMGHEPDLKAHLEQECGYKLDVEVIDILRDKSNIEFKRDAEASIVVVGNKLEITDFFPMNLMQKLSLQKESVSEWRELVEQVVIDWNYGGAAMEPSIIDNPEENEFVKGLYDIPSDAGTIKIKITDLLSESYEEVIKYG